MEKRGDWDSAAVEYKKLQDIDSPPPIAFNLLGDLFHKKGDQPEALIWYEKAIERYAQEGLYGNAIGICRKALRQDCERLQVLERLGGLFFSQGLAREAVNHYLLYAHSVARRGDVGIVLETTEKIRQILPEDPEVREKMGQLLQGISSDEEALIEYRAAIQCYRRVGLDEEADRIVSAAGDLGELEGDFPVDREEASENVEPVDLEVDIGNGIEATIEPTIDPGMIETIAPRDAESGSAVIGSIDDNDFLPVGEILREFQDGVDRILDEDDYQSHYDLGMSYKEMGLYEEAMREFQFCSPSPDHRTASLEMKSAILIELGRYEECLTIVRDLISEKDGNEAGCHFLMGMAYEKQGHAEKALEEYRIVASLDPHFQNVRERIAQVEQ